MHDAAPPPVEGIDRLANDDHFAGDGDGLVIWLVAPLDPCPGDLSPPRRFWTLARELAARRHDVVLWTSGFDHDSLRLRLPPESLEGLELFRMRTLAVQAYRTRVSRRRFVSHRKFADRFEREAIGAVATGELERPDLIIASMPPLESTEAAIHLARRLDTTIVLDLLGDWPDCEVSVAAGSGWLRKVQFAIASASFRGCSLESLRRRRAAALGAADACVASSEDVARAASQRDAMILPLGAFPQEFTKRTRRPRMEAGEASSAESPGGSARSGEGAGIDIVVHTDPLTEADASCLVEAVGIVARAGDRVRVHAVGGGRAGTLLRRAADGQAIVDAGRIVSESNDTRGEWIELLSRCDAAIAFGPVREPLPIPAETCEALAAGLPLLCGTDTGGGGQLADLVERFGAGMAFRRNEASSLAAVIRRLADDPSRLAMASAGARRLAEHELDRERICSRYADWLESLA